MTMPEEPPAAGVVPAPWEVPLPPSALRDAHEELRTRAEAADADTNFIEGGLLWALADVADHTKRVADHPGEYYRWEKVSVLAAAALRARTCVFRAGVDGDDDEAVSEACRSIMGVEENMAGVLGRLAEGRPLRRSQAARLAEAVRELATWSEGVVAGAVPDEAE